MAPMDDPGQATALPTQDVEQVLKGQSQEELEAMGRRLLRSIENLKEFHEELQVEQKDLQAEGVHLRTTIDLMMKEMHKLNIGSDNTVTPGIEEGPLDFVGRVWDRVRPRDRGVIVNEHVGEIRKAPHAFKEDGEPVEIRNPAVEKVLETTSKVKETIGPLWMQGQASVRQAWQNLREGQEADAANRASGASAAKGQGARPQRHKAKGKAREAPAAEAPAGGVLGFAQGLLSRFGPAEEAPAAAGYPPAVTPAAPAPAPAAATSAGSEDAAAAKEEVAEKEEAKVEKEAEAKEEEKGEDEEADDKISSTILIEAKITLPDGTAQMINVRASERCKEVAQRFVKEHSLKANFVQPLTSFLKKVEADAERFPVSVNGDLMELQKEFSKQA